MLGFLGLACAAGLVSCVLSTLFRPNGSVNYFFSGLNFLYFLFVIWTLWGMMGSLGFAACFKFYFIHMGTLLTAARSWIMGA